MRNAIRWYRRPVPTMRGVDWTRFKAVLFDLDGVLTPTADVHMRAWSEMFNAYLDSAEQARRAGDASAPGLGADLSRYTDADYFTYVDGKPRYDGVRSFLESRNITLPEGDPSDSANELTVCGLGNRKNEAFNYVLERDGVEAYPGSVRLLDALAEQGLQMAVVSSSANAQSVLKAAGLFDRFEHIVDGVRAKAEGLPGKPAPDTYQRAAELCGVTAAESVVVEDAISGVEAGRAGDFGFVLGVDRGTGPEVLLEAGADTVVSDLAEVVP